MNFLRRGDLSYRNRKARNYRYLAVIIAMLLDYLSDGVQKHMIKISSPLFERLISAYGEDVMGTFVLYTLISLLGFHSGGLWILLLLISNLWELLQYFHLIKGTAEFPGDSIAYFIGISIAWFFNQLIKKRYASEHVV